MKRFGNHITFQEEEELEQAAQAPPAPEDDLEGTGDEEPMDAQNKNEEEPKGSQVGLDQDQIKVVADAAVGQTVDDSELESRIREGLEGVYEDEIDEIVNELLKAAAFIKRGCIMNNAKPPMVQERVEQQVEACHEEAVRRIDAFIAEKTQEATKKEAAGPAGGAGATAPSAPGLDSPLGGVGIGEVEGLSSDEYVKRIANPQVYAYWEANYVERVPNVRPAKGHAQPRTRADDAYANYIASKRR